MFQAFLTKLRQYEIRIRKAVNNERQGNFHSVFKGSGLEFDDLRLYQYGDDVRAIDWNTSAKGHGTYIKIFKEEKEQTVFFMVDVSASQQVGDPSRLKIDTTKEKHGESTTFPIRYVSVPQATGTANRYCSAASSSSWSDTRMRPQYSQTMIFLLIRMSSCLWGGMRL